MGFVSRTLTAAEWKYSQLDKEALASVFGVKWYHQYVYGWQFEPKLTVSHSHIFSRRAELFLQWPQQGFSDGH